MTAKAKGKRPPIKLCPTCNQATLRRHCPETGTAASPTCGWVRCASCKSVGLADGSHWTANTTGRTT